MRALNLRQASGALASSSPRCSPPVLVRGVRSRAVPLVAARRCYVAAATARAGTAGTPSLLDLEFGYPTGFGLDWTSRVPAWDILGLAQSMVDITTEEAVHDELLAGPLAVEKGGRRVLASADERHAVLEALAEAGCTTKITPGGSLANTLVALARLSAAAASSSSPPCTSTHQRGRLNVALATSCGSDAIGEFFESQLEAAGVAVLPAAGDDAPPGHTGTVFVLPSADAQRSFLSFFHSEALAPGRQLLRAAARARLVVIEGYLWELPGAAAAIRQVVTAARANGARVCLTAGDPGVVARHRDSILEVLHACGSDVLLFANMEEACELVGSGRLCCPRAAAERLGRLCGVAVVTNGGEGSFVAHSTASTSSESSGIDVTVHAIEPVAPPAPPGVVDTCGAGDAYAAGFVFALTSGVGCPLAAGRFAGLVAARVISRHGAQLQEHEAHELAALLPDLVGAFSGSGAALPPFLRVPAAGAA